MWRSVVIGVSAVLAFAQPVSAQPNAVDHALWGGLLSRHVKQGLVDYEGLRAEADVLEQYLALMKATDVTQLPSQEGQLAFWINAYNACVVKGVLDHRPLRSVKEVKGFFDGIRYEVGRQSLTLNEIEAKGWALGDWRIHFAVVCASSSCPVLRAEAYVPERLQTQLIEDTARFFNDPTRGLRVEGNRLWVSKIFKWHPTDFVPAAKLGPFHRLTPDTLLVVIMPYLSPDLVQVIKHRRLVLRFLDYDWSLNIAR